MAKGPTVSTTFNAVDKLSRPMKRMQKTVLKFAAAAGAAFITGRAAQAINNFASAGDEIAKTARKIGLSVESLQELRFAADRSGVSAEAFSTSMQKLNKNVGDLRAGTGSLKTILDKTNPAMAEQLMNAKDNEEAFNILVKALSETENQMDKAALAQAAFGRTGQDLLIMTEGGAEGIASLREEAKKYGDIISTDAAAASEKFVDSMTNMKAAGMAVRNKAIAPLIDKLQPLIQGIADYVAMNQNLINQGIDKTFTAIGKTIRTIVKLWDSGFLPALLAGVVTYQAITKSILIYEGIMKIATAAQAIFNAIMSAGPFGLIVLGIAALIAIIVLLVKNWDKVKAAFKAGIQAIKGFLVDLWNGFMKLLDNPFFTTIGLLFDPWITIPALIIKHWQPIMDFFKKLVDTVGGAISSVGNFFKSGGIPSSAETMPTGNPRLIGRNDGNNQRSAISGSASLDVNFNNAPAGTTSRQRGSVQGINMNMGFGGGGL